MCSLTSGGSLTQPRYHFIAGPNSGFFTHSWIWIAFTSQVLTPYYQDLSWQAQLRPLAASHSQRSSRKQDCDGINLTQTSSNHLLPGTGHYSKISPSPSSVSSSSALTTFKSIAPFPSSDHQEREYHSCQCSFRRTLPTSQSSTFAQTCWESNAPCTTYQLRTIPGA